MPDNISMSFTRLGKVINPIRSFQINGSTIIAVYKGTLSPFDILIKYRQRLKNRKWSAIRTPKHIHWTVDVLMKMQSYEKLTKEFLDFFIEIWNATKPIKNKKERELLDLEALLNINKREVERFKKLSTKGEYSVRFLILLAKLLMLQEKTNRSDAYMFKQALDGLKEGKDLFKVLSIVSLPANRK